LAPLLASNDVKVEDDGLDLKAAVGLNGAVMGACTKNILSAGAEVEMEVEGGAKCTPQYLFLKYTYLFGLGLC